MVMVGLLLSLQASAADWPHWRGPFLNGTADEKNLPDKWSKTENVAWVCSLPGHSSATAVIARGRVFVSSTDREGPDLFALCIDAKSGRELWRRKLGLSDRKAPRNNMATPSPVTDGEHVYFMYGSGHLAGLDFEGNVIWSRNIEKEYGNISIKYGYSSSPLLVARPSWPCFHGLEARATNKLYILIQRRHTAYRAPESKNLDAFILAVDPKTGKNIFKQPRTTDALDESLDSYSSPILFDNNGRAEILVIGGDYVTANDPETGKEIWRYGYAEEKSERWRNIASPTTGEGLIFAVRPRGGNGLFALKSGGKGTLSKDYVAWTFDGPTPDVCVPLYYKGLLYVLDGKASKTVTCLDAKTGREKWQGKLGGSSPWRASLTAADDKIYCISESAEAVVLAAGGEQFRIISRFDMEDKPVQASIAIADGCLFIRTASKLYCISK